MLSPDSALSPSSCMLPLLLWGKREVGFASASCSKCPPWIVDSGATFHAISRAQALAEGVEEFREVKAIEIDTANGNAKPCLPFLFAHASKMARRWQSLGSLRVQSKRRAAQTAATESVIIALAIIIIIIIIIIIAGISASMIHYNTSQPKHT